MPPVRRPRREQSASAVTRQPGSALPPRKSVLSTRRISLFERTVSVRLSPAATELLLGSARILSEGELDRDAFAGSTMASIELARTADRVSDPVDPSTAQLLAELCRTDLAVRGRCRALALGEATRLAGAELDAAQVDIESTARGTELHLSFNVEAKRRIA